MDLPLNPHFRMAITLEIKEGNRGFSIHVKALSGRAKLSLAYLMTELNAQLGVPIEDKITPLQARHLKGAIRVQSERLKRLNTLEGAKAWIDRFHSIPIADQIAFLDGRRFKALDKHFVAVKAQYFRLVVPHFGKNITHFTTQDKAYAEATLVGYEGRGYLRRTVGRNLVLTKAEYEAVKDSIEEKRIDAPGIVGMGLDVKDTRRGRLKGQDRHSGYRTTTNPNFSRNK